jgi:hypothetical protein
MFDSSPKVNGWASDKKTSNNNNNNNNSSSSSSSSSRSRKSSVSNNNRTSNGSPHSEFDFNTSGSWAKTAEPAAGLGRTMSYDSSDLEDRPYNRSNRY